MEKYCRARQVTDDSIIWRMRRQVTDDSIRVIWRMRLECWVTKERIRTYAQIIKYGLFSTGTMVTRTLLSLTFYVYVLSCFLKQYGTGT